MPSRPSLSRAALRIAAVVAVGFAATGIAGAPSGAAGSSRAAAVTVFVTPDGRGPGQGTEQHPFHGLAAAQAGIRARLRDMHADVHVVLADGTYRLTRPLVFSAADSGRHGHRVVYEAAPGAHPVVSGGTPVHGFRLTDPARNLWTAAVPRALRTRQLWVDGQRAPVASGSAPVALTQTATGYTAVAPVMASWSNPRGIELVYDRAPSNWTQTRCRVRAIRGTAIVMVQPCWDNITKRADDPHTVVARSGFGQRLTAAPRVTNAAELLDQPGEWYLDDTAHTLSIVPPAGTDPNQVSVVAGRLPTLVAGRGTASAPVHDLEFRGLTFSHGTWLGPSGPEGYADYQTAQLLHGRNGYRRGGDCTRGHTCQYNQLASVPASVTFTHARDITLASDRFVHTGATGLAFDAGTSDSTVTGSEFTDTSCAGLSIGRFDVPTPSPANRTTGIRVRNSWVHATGAEYQSCPGIVIGYAQHVIVDHNQVNDQPYSGITIGWGGWRERLGDLAPLPNSSRDNVISKNLVFDYMQVMADGGGIYSNGVEGPTLRHGETVAGNVVMQQHGLSWAIYTDNGATNVTVRANVVWDVLVLPAMEAVFPGVAPQFSFGGCSSGPVAFDGNWSVQPDPVRGLIGPLAVCGGHPLVGVTSTANHVIDSLADVPSVALDRAGIRGRAREQLAPTPRPTNLPPSQSP